MLRECHLDDNTDAITWHFNADDKYSTRSAYHMHFVGVYAEFDWDQVWKLKAEAKCKFFTSYYYKISYGPRTELSRTVDKQMPSVSCVMHTWKWCYI
jgi:hypothetical protein